MKILQIIPNFELAGAQTMCENLIMKLKEDTTNIVEVVSFYTLKSKITERIEKNGIKIHYLNKKRGLDISIFFKVKQIISKFQPDVIHTHMYSLEYLIPVIILSKHKIRIIHTVHNIAEKEVPANLQKIQKILFKRNLVVPVAISEKVKESIIKRYGIENKSIPVIYNGIDLKKCHVKENYNVSNSIVHIGRFSEQKNHMELLEIFSECKKINGNLKLYLIGNGELKNDVKNKVEQMNLSNDIVFCGELPECFEILNKADIFVMPSKWEGMPMTIIEAMATGVPVVANDVGGISNMIDNEINGYIVNGRREFIDCIKRLYDSEELRKKIGNNAEKKAKEFDSNTMAEKYYKLYKEKNNEGRKNIHY